MKYLKQRISFFFLFLLGFSVVTVHSQKLMINGHSFFLDEKPFDMWGVRVASASQNNEYTNELISNLNDYKAAGINTISVFLQGSSGGYSDPFENGGLEIQKDHWKRIEKIIKECAKRDMVVIVGIFYQRTIKNPEISKLSTEKEIRNAVRTVTKKLISYSNVIINIANEQNSNHYKSFKAFDFNKPENIIGLCREVKTADPRRIVGGGGYQDDLNVIIGKSEYVDVLLFDTFSEDIKSDQHSGWHFDYFREQGVPDKPIVNVELFGGWTRQFMPQGVYTNAGKEVHYKEIEAAKRRPGLYVHLHSNPWFQGVAQDLENRYDLGGVGTSDNPGVRWYFNKIKKLENPVTVKYLKKKLRKQSPRLILNKKAEKNLREKLKTDPVIQNVYNGIKLNAEAVFEKPIINLDIPMEERSQNNQLDISRDLLHRVSMMAMVYRIEKDQRMLDRINEEVIAACNFPSWFPRHFLDVAEMSLGIALAIDWTAGDLPASTIDLAKRSLVEKGIKPSWPESGRRGPFYGHSNWNQVCNGGMVAAAIAVAEVEPELAAKTIHRALDGMVNALAKYGPDGVYPEGATYWRYGTSFTVTTAAMFESAFGTDFGIFEYPGFKASAVFRILSVAPSGLVYNFADSGERSGRNGDITLGWFAAKTGNKKYFERDLFMKSPEEMGNLSRLAAPALVWLAQYEEKGEETIPTAWKGDGDNPIVFFTGGENDPNKYYFGGKGGSGSVSHGNMDGGSFVFELYGQRWVIDPGNTGRYGRIERTGFGLWQMGQDGDRWKLLNKGNFGHSTISVNNQLHQVDGKATTVDFKDGINPEAAIDLTPAFGGLLNSATRRFIKDGPASLVIEDNIEISDKTELVTWQLITQADVQIVEGGAVLSQEGKSIKVENLSHPDLMISVISLYPPPMDIDTMKEGLKRLEIRIPAWTINDGKTTIKVRLSGKEN